MPLKKIKNDEEWSGWGNLDVSVICIFCLTIPCLLMLIVGSWAHQLWSMQHVGDWAFQHPAEIERSYQEHYPVTWTMGPRHSCPCVFPNFRYLSNLQLNGSFPNSHLPKQIVGPAYLPTGKFICFKLHRYHKVCLKRGYTPTYNPLGHFHRQISSNNPCTDSPQ